MYSLTHRVHYSVQTMYIYTGFFSVLFHTDLSDIILLHFFMSYLSFFSLHSFYNSHLENKYKTLFLKKLYF